MNDNFIDVLAVKCVNPGVFNLHIMRKAQEKAKIGKYERFIAFYAKKTTKTFLLPNITNINIEVISYLHNSISITIDDTSTSLSKEKPIAHIELTSVNEEKTMLVSIGDTDAVFGIRDDIYTKVHETSYHIESVISDVKIEYTAKDPLVPSQKGKNEILTGENKRIKIDTEKDLSKKLNILAKACASEANLNLYFHDEIVKKMTISTKYNLIRKKNSLTQYEIEFEDDGHEKFSGMMVAYSYGEIDEEKIKKYNLMKNLTIHPQNLKRKFNLHRVKCTKGLR